MENTSKALLIAAAVLIVIILITLGIKLLKPNSQVQTQATDAGKAISEKTATAADLAISHMGERSIGGSGQSGTEPSGSSATGSGQSGTGGSGNSEAGTTVVQTLGSITASNYGDYIDLGTTIISDKPADWRIFYNDKNGHVYAILADYLPNSTGVAASAGFNTSGTYKVYLKGR